VGEQPHSALRLRIVLARTKVNVPPDGERSCVNRLHCFCCFAIRVNPHVAKVVAKAWFNKCARGRIEGLARRVKHFVNIDWHFPLTLSPTTGEYGALQRLRADQGCLGVLPRVFLALATRMGLVSAGVPALQQSAWRESDR
jgi:hypothetical protein